jgi:uncharacterized SAM-dependent methyltransferase
MKNSLADKALTDSLGTDANVPMEVIQLINEDLGEDFDLTDLEEM